ncbi:MAG: hypothetical protein IPK18_03555 [Sphingobacteriales bacterium]|nr:MAG: hypothetical protein IPK18_03555 [Sphingobacteriales bacterium]
MGQKAQTANTGLAKVAVQCSADTFVVNQSLVLRISICGKNRHLRQARNRYASPYDNRAINEQTDKNENRQPTLRKIKRGASQRTKPTLLHHI